MKFKQQLNDEKRLAPEFTYVEYRALEGAAKRYKYELDQVQGNDVPDEGQCDELREAFFAEVRNNAHAVEACFQEKLDTAEHKLRALTGDAIATTPLTEGSDQDRLNSAHKAYATFHIPEDSSSQEKLTEEYRVLYIHLLDLNKMRKVNREAIRKIVKKFDKASGETNQNVFMADEVDVLSFAKENALKGIEERLLSSIKQKVFRNAQSPELAFQAFREATLLRRQQKLQKMGAKFNYQEYYQLIAYVVLYMGLLLFLSLFVHPQFSANPAENWKGYVVIFGVLTGVLLIALHGKPADVSLMSVNIMFLTLEIITAEQAFSGFSNAGVIANGILLPFARALSMAGGAELALMKCLGKPSSEPAALVRMCLVVGTLSAVLNNTPIVFMMIPILQVWCSRLNMSVSKFMLPMSFAIMLGGTCSIVGSSANLVTIGIASTYSGNFPPGQQPPYTKPSFFSTSVIGLPVFLIGIVWMVITSRALLPKRIPAPGDRAVGLAMASSSRTLSGGALGNQSAGGFKATASTMQTPAVFSSNARFEVSFEFVNPLIGSTVEETGVTRLGPSVLRIHNIDAIHKNIGAEEPPIDGSPWMYKIKAGDIAVFYCSSQQVNTVRQYQGLKIYNKHISKIVGDRRDKALIEVTVGAKTFLEGKSCLDLDLRKKYNVCCLAVFKKNANQRRRNAGRDVEFKREQLQEGDILLLECVKKAALSQFTKSKWFASIVVIENSAPPMRDTRNMIVTMGALLLLVVLTASEVIDIVALGFIIVAAFISLRVITTKEAWASLKGDVLLTIAASFGIGQAMSNSGVAMWVGNGITSATDGSEFAVLSLVYVFTVTLGMFLNNAAVAVLVYPVAYAACVENAGIDPELVVLLIIMGAGLSFTTPMSYQTNQMVQAPGGYKFVDYVKFGGSLQIATGVASVVVLYALAQIGWVKHHHAMWKQPIA